jgi:hypothetical protein
MHVDRNDNPVEGDAQNLEPWFTFRGLTDTLLPFYGLMEAVPPFVPRIEGLDTGEKRL